MLENLASLGDEDLKSFLNSFDTVLCDCDGVIWKLTTPLAGVKDTFAKLRGLGKKIHFVTNNCYFRLEEFQKKLNNCQFNVKVDDIVSPTVTIIDYLKAIDFKKEIFIFGLPALRQELLKAGYKIAHSGPSTVDEKLEDLPNHLKDDENIGAVILDVDVNTNYIKLLKAIVYLQRPDVLFIAGAIDTKIPLGFDIHLVGPGYFRPILEDLSGRKATLFGKPSERLNDYIVKKFNIEDPSRILFIGDSLDQDIAFAGKHGYQKLLVLTGVTNLEEAKQLEKDEQIPDYYLDSLGDLHRLITRATT